MEFTAPLRSGHAEPQVVVPVVRVFLFRFADRQLRGLLFQPPPRVTQFVAY
jgi:hypothetical protein